LQTNKIHFSCRVQYCCLTGQLLKNLTRSDSLPLDSWVQYYVLYESSINCNVLFTNDNIIFFMCNIHYTKWAFCVCIPWNWLARGNTYTSCNDLWRTLWWPIVVLISTLLRWFPFPLLSYSSYILFASARHGNSLSAGILLVQYYNVI